MTGDYLEFGFNPDYFRYHFPWSSAVGQGQYRREYKFALVSQIEEATNGLVSAENPAFSNAVLAVAVSSLSTNITAEVYIAATNACANLGLDPALIPQGGTLGTVGGLLVALAAAVALLRKKTKLLKSDGTAEDDFATDLLGKQVAISAMRYGLASTSATVKAADRTVTKVTLGTTAVTVTFPDADENGKTRDFLLRIDAANFGTGGSFTITKPTGATIYGDAFPSPEATKQYLVAITETAEMSSMSAPLKSQSRRRAKR